MSRARKKRDTKSACPGVRWATDTPEFPRHAMRRLRDQTFGNQLSLKKHSVSQKSFQANKEFIYLGLPHCRRFFTS